MRPCVERIRTSQKASSGAVACVARIAPPAKSRVTALPDGWPAPSYFFLPSLLASAAAASLAVGTVPPAAWVMLISDSPDPTKTSSMMP